MPHEAKNPPPEDQGIFSRIGLSLKLLYFRILLFIQSLRYEKPGGAVRVFRDHTDIGVQDNHFRLSLPSARRITRYRGGIGWRINRLAERYGCPEFFEPRTGDVVVDIGANVGEFSLYAASKGATAIAFEPDPSVYECLRRNLERYPGASALQLALWNERATLKFFSAVDRADSSLITPETNVGTVCEVDAVPLDEVAEIAALPRIDFIKIDGEGAEPEILQGAKRTLQITRRIAIDVGPERQGEPTREAAIVILESSGFTISENESTNELFAIRQ